MTVAPWFVWNGATINPMKIKLHNVRLSFPKLFKAEAFSSDEPDKKSEPKFGAAFLLNKKTNAAEIAAMKKGIADLLAAEVQDPKARAAYKPCLRDGSEKPDIDGYGDEVMFFNAVSEKRPVVVDRTVTPIAESDDKIYAGCYVNASIVLWVQNNKYGKRVNAQLRAVQFVKDGEAFGEAPVNAEEEFDSLPEEENVL